MRGFWWFRENHIAGMGRPGFNAFRIRDFSFEEATLIGWIGQYSSGEIPLETFDHHLTHYIPLTFPYHGLTNESGAELVNKLRSPEIMVETLNHLKTRTQYLEWFELGDKALHFRLNKTLLEKEIEFLKEKRIGGIVTLTEKHHSRNELAEHFELHHISIEDMRAPTFDQARQLAKIIEKARSKDIRLVVHCLAGIGRTSTMIIAAHVLLGEKLETLTAEDSQANPQFGLTRSQTSFLESVKKSL